MDNRIMGTVKWFSNERGYGFVVSDDEADDTEYFVHFSYIQMDGYKTLRAGQKVSFSLVDTDRGVQAQEITPED
jgi:CspA family cold shock protein